MLERHVGVAMGDIMLSTNT